MTLSLTPVEILAGLGVLLTLVFVWRAGARSGARLVSLVGRVLLTAGLIVAVQWVVLTHQPGVWLTLGVLGVPALFASHTLTRALTITTHDMPRRRGGERR